MSYLLTPTLPMTLQSSATTGNGGILLLKGECERVTIVVQGSSGVSAGAVTIEEAYYDPNGPVYAGTWDAIGSAVTVVASTQAVTHGTGSYWAIRARISTTVEGGTVTVYAWGN